ncbi:MAG: LLM class flavin-dependent oxidoreductase [Chloroflexi bacterium]|nr:LLM class flavin-dependent oxidoreductase [Chloroflexota bacterium]
MVEIDFRCGILGSTDKVLTFAEEVENLGYGGLWFSHSVGRDFRRHDTLMLLAAVAARTSRIKLGTGVFQACLYPPVALTRMLTTIDHLSNGRLMLGVGTGWVPKEFENLGVPFRERAGRTDEALEIIKRLWTEKEVTYEGKYYKIREAKLDPKPVATPHPKILMGGVYNKGQRGAPGEKTPKVWSEKALRRLARFADGWVTPSSIDFEDAPEVLPEAMERIKAAAREIGRIITDEEFILVAESGPFNIDESKEKALQDAEQAYLYRTAGGFFQVAGNPSFEQLLSAGVCGPAEDVAAFVNKWLAMGKSVPALKRIQFNIASTDPVEQLRRFHTQVRPMLTGAAP